MTALRADDGRGPESVHPFGLTTLVDALEATLVDALGLAAMPLDPALARAESAWRGGVVAIEAHAFAGPAVRYARFVRLRGAGGLEIGNVLAVPRPAYPLPVLGVDLVALGPDRALFVADLVPTLPPGPGRDAQLARWARDHGARAALPPGGALPAWAAAWFSPYALHARIAPAERAAGVAAVEAAARAFAEGARDAQPRPDTATEVGAATADYIAAHRDGDRGMGLLGRIFDPRWAQHFVTEVLFPVSLPS